MYKRSAKLVTSLLRSFGDDATNPANTKDVGSHNMCPMHVRKTLSHHEVHLRFA